MELTHIRENSEDTERHLSENRKKFEGDCLFLYKLMMTGRRLTTQDVRDMKIDDRRLRNLREWGKCESEWMFQELPDGKRKRTHVEFFITIPKPPTKTELIQKADKAISEMKNAERELVTVFSLDENPPTYQQKSLFE